MAEAWTLRKAIQRSGLPCFWNKIRTHPNPSPRSLGKQGLHENKEGLKTWCIWSEWPNICFCTCTLPTEGLGTQTWPWVILNIYTLCVYSIFQLAEPPCLGGLQPSDICICVHSFMSSILCSDLTLLALHQITPGRTLGNHMRGVTGACTWVCCMQGKFPNRCSISPTLPPPSFCFVFFLGYIWHCSKLIPGSVLRNPSWWACRIM